MNHGYRAEDILEQICSDIFGLDLVSRSPVVHEPSGDKELVDILIKIGNELLIIQSKSIDIDAADLNDVSGSRVLNKIVKAKQQFSTTLNAQKRKIPFTYVNGVGVKRTENWTKTRVSVGLITINIRDSKFKDPEFRTSFPLLVDEFRKMRVHIFILHDLFELRKEFSTPRDFLEYLSDREFANESGALWAGNELDFVAWLKTRHDKWLEFKNGKSEFSGLFLGPGLWEDFSQNEKVARLRKQNFLDSKIFDDTLSSINSTIQESIQKKLYTEEEAINHYETIVSLLSKVKRVQRRDIGRKWQEKIQKSKSSMLSYFVSIFEDCDLSIFFLVVNDENRENRLNGFFNMSVTLSRQLTTTKLLGVIMTGMQTPQITFDFALYEVADLQKEEMVMLPQEIFGARQDYNLKEWEID